MKGLVIEVKAGRAVRKYKVVKSDGPNDLVFQSVKDGRPMRDNNILARFIKPAARKIGLEFVNWRCLRTSHATWLKMAGCGCQRCTGANAPLAGHDNAGHLPAVCTRKPETGGGKAQQFSKLIDQ
jgi:integrase